MKFWLYFYCTTEVTTVIHTPPCCSTTWTMELFTKELTELYKLDGVWSERCSRIFESLPMAVFQLDKIQQFFMSINCIEEGKAILIDPLTVLCLNCKKFVRLKIMTNGRYYIWRATSTVNQQNLWSACSVPLMTVFRKACSSNTQSANILVKWLKSCVQDSSVEIWIQTQPLLRNTRRWQIHLPWHWRCSFATRMKDSRFCCIWV